MRVRFAPSPTGALHIGGARTALYNWLLARGAAAASWCCGSRTPTASAPRRRTSRRSSRRSSGSGSTGTASRSSSRSAPPRHGEVVEQLLAGGHAYRSTAGPDEVRAYKEAHGNRGFRGEDEGTGAVRLRVPDEGAHDRRRRRARRDRSSRTRSRTTSSSPAPTARPSTTSRSSSTTTTPASPTSSAAPTTTRTPQARPDPAGDGDRDAGLRAPAAAARAGRQEALQAPRRRLRPGAARPRLPARGGAQLPRAARLGLRRRDDVLHHGGAAARLQPRGRLEVARGVRRAEAALDERPLPARAERSTT